MNAGKTEGGEILLDFASYIKKFHSEYQFDQHNERVIQDLGLWATRNEHFHKRGEGFHMDRGILLMGSPGVGKDELMRLLRQYLSYIRSSYGYKSKVVWSYAKEFQKDKVGYSCFDGDKGNIYYEELALTDEGSNPITCSRENVNHYGNKLLIGREIIQIRYNQFKQYGWQTHFSTNCTPDELHKVYGARCIDRLYEMCNFIVLPGKSKRGKIAPTFINNVNQATPPPPRETTVDEHHENRLLLEADYQYFLKENRVSGQAPMYYFLLKSYGCDLGNDDDMRLNMELVEKNYVTPQRREFSGTFDEHKKNWIWLEARKLSVSMFYQRLKNENAQSIFKDVNVPMDALVRGIAVENKKQQ